MKVKFSSEIIGEIGEFLRKGLARPGKVEGKLQRGKRYVKKVAIILKSKVSNKTSLHVDSLEM